MSDMDVAVLCGHELTITERNFNKKWAKRERNQPITTTTRRPPPTATTATASAFPVSEWQCSQRTYMQSFSIDNFNMSESERELLHKQYTRREQCRRLLGLPLERDARREGRERGKMWILAGAGSLALIFLLSICWNAYKGWRANINRQSNGIRSPFALVLFLRSDELLQQFHAIYSSTGRPVRRIQRFHLATAASAPLKYPSQLQRRA